MVATILKSNLRSFITLVFSDHGELSEPLGRARVEQHSLGLKAIPDGLTGYCFVLFVHPSQPISPRLQDTLSKKLGARVEAVPITETATGQFFEVSDLKKIFSLAGEVRESLIFAAPFDSDTDVERLLTHLAIEIGMRPEVAAISTLLGKWPDLLEFDSDLLIDSQNTLILSPVFGVRAEALAKVSVSMERGQVSFTEFCLIVSVHLNQNHLLLGTLVCPIAIGGDGRAALRRVQQEISPATISHRNELSYLLAEQGEFLQRVSDSILPSVPSVPARADRMPDSERPTTVVFTSIESGGASLAADALLKRLRQQTDVVQIHSGRDFVEITMNDLATLKFEELDAMKAFIRISPIREYLIYRFLRREVVGVLHFEHLHLQSLGLKNLGLYLSAPITYITHDFHPLCPTATLIDESNSFCGGSCSSGTGACSTFLYPKSELAFLKNAYVHKWRAESADFLARAEHVFYQSDFSKRTFELNIPEGTLPFRKTFISPEYPIELLSKRSPLGTSKSRNSILVLGQASPHKGSFLLSAVAVELGKLGLEVFFRGEEKGANFHYGNITEYPAYDLKGVAALVRKIRPKLILFYPVWPETFGFAGLEAVLLGLPTVIISEGAGGLVEQLREFPESAKIIPPGSPANLAEIIKGLTVGSGYKLWRKNVHQDRMRVIARLTDFSAPDRLENQLFNISQSNLTQRG